MEVDVTDPKATQEVRMKTLAAMAEVVVRRCVVGGTGCGGEVEIGDEGRLRMVVAYYTAIDGVGGGLPWRGNGNMTRLVEVGRHPGRVGKDSGYTSL